MRTPLTASQTSASSTAARFNPFSALRRAFQVNALLTLVGLAMIPLAIVAVAGLFVDHQVITGAPAWEKPLKFAISTCIYAFTLIYLLTFVHGHPRLVTTLSSVSALGLAVELTLIPMQVIRGTTSHFNHTTEFDTAVYYIMAGFIVLVWLAGFGAALLLLRQRLPDSAWAWSLRLGMLIALVGMSVGILMTFPTAEQLEMAKMTHQMPIIGAHTVGAPDGGPGLPFVGWSTVAGDLRVPHFFGLHGLQALIFVGFLARRMNGWLDVRHRVALVVTVAVAYLMVTGMLVWQALRAQSIIHPDGLTLAAFGALVLATALVAAGIVLHGRRLGGATKMERALA